MNTRMAWLGLAMFLAGWASGLMLHSSFDSYADNYDNTVQSGLAKNSYKQSISNSINLKGEQSLEPTIDVPSPSERVSKNDIFIYDDHIVVKIENPQWAVFTDTNSMDPVIDSASKAIEIAPQSEKDVHIGDIVAYKSEYSEAIVAHRVVDIGYDELGWYAIIKGDNNNYPDIGKVRFSQIKMIVVAVVY